MKEGRPSLTALYVAFARALATHEPALSRACHDPFAERLLPSVLGKLVAPADPSRASARLLRGLRASMLGMGEHLALRTRVIDDALDDAVMHGARNVVIVGAGLDARAHRLESLRECAVFEVDFPSTQAFKRTRAHGLPMLARAHHYVPCDFERNDLESALLASGFEATTRSAWIWEGVTMYLPAPVVAASLATLARLSAPGSRLIATYLLPTVHEHKAVAAIGLSLLGALSEPIRSSFDVEEMATLLRQHDFAPLRDVSPRDLAMRYAIHFPKLALGAPRERVVVAEKRGRT